MKLVLLLSASFACISATSEPRYCFTKPTRGLPGKECVFPFQYQGSTYYSCTNLDTTNGEAWCGTVADVRFNKFGRIVAGDVGDCDFENSECPPATATGYCDHEIDCYSNGNICDPAPPGSSGCVCKNNQCKLSSGCGTPGLNWFNACSDCNAEDCEDEGVCSVEYLPGGSRCTGPETADDSRDEYCTVTSDCYSNGSDPPPPGSNGYVCKNNKCKLSSGCGQLGLSTNLFNACSACDAEDCEDEGVCTLEYLPGGSRCTGPETSDGGFPLPPVSSCNTKAGKACIFPFVYKGELYDKCTYVDSEEPWCANVPTVTIAGNGKIVNGNEVGDCFLAPGSQCQVEDDQSCTFDSDCRGSGKLCDPTSGVQDVGCICRKGVCDISSGCGTNGAFFFKSCSQCDTDLDGCEDEGACKVAGTRSGAKCVAK